MTTGGTLCVMWAWLAACGREGGVDGGGPDEAESLPPVTAVVPWVAPATGAGGDAPRVDDGCAAGTWVLTSFTGPTTSGVLILDRAGVVRWAWVVAEAEDRVLRVRPAADGHGLMIAVGDRVVRNGSQGVILRVTLDGETVSSTPTRDPHHDFLELPDGRFAWLGYEFSQPANGATLQYLATDRVHATPEGGGEDEVLFSTLGDYTWLPRAPVPPEGLDGRTLPGFEVWGQGASLGYREADDTLFLLWAYQDALVAFDGGGAGIRWVWGGIEPDLVGGPSFSRAHFSDLWDDQVLVFDNRRPTDGPSRLVRYTFDDESYRETWSFTDGWWEDGVGDVRRIPSCDSVLASWPSRGRIAEIGPDGEERWAVTVDARIERAEVLRALPW